MDNTLYNKGDLELVELLVNSVKDFKVTDSDNNTALMLAAKAGRAYTVEQILRKDSSIIDLQNNQGWTAFMFAVDADQVEVAEVLLKNGADPSVKNRQGRMAASYVSEQSSDVLSLLIQESILNRRDKKGMTRLMHAILKKDVDLVKSLVITDAEHVERGMNSSLGITDKDGGTALMYAAASGNMEIVKLLLENGAAPFIEVRDRKNTSPLMLAACFDNIEIVKLLLDAGANPKFTEHELSFMWMYSPSNQKKMSKMLMTALIYRNESTDLIRAVVKGDAKKVREELDNARGYGVENMKLYVDAVDNKNTSALLEASSHSRFDIAEILFMYGNANPNVFNGNGLTPLMLATMYDQYRTVELLIRYGANLNAQNRIGQTALMQAAIHNSKRCANLLIRNGADVNIQDMDGNLAYAYAIAKDHLEVAEMLRVASTVNTKAFNILRAVGVDDD